ncbi:MAG: molybdenum cofactor guanylyltransferase [Syntrophomonadaceae bacterium]|jgi:molybdopterin-guanine dinucleotide biosynthesis protein A
MSSAAILAGGRSSRMGSNKALASLNGVTVLEYILGRLQPRFEEILIVTNEPALFEFYPARVITDIYPRKGPIAGIHAALSSISEKQLFLLSCDMPFIQVKLIFHMLEHSADYDAVVPVVAGRIQPTAAVYQKSCLPLLTDCLENDKLKLTRIFEDLHTLYIEEAVLSSFGPVKEMFFNINDPTALEKAREIARRGLR